MIKFHCPHCDIKISAESADAGTSANCPSCGISLVVPQKAVGVTDTNPLEELPAISADISDSPSATNDAATHELETNELTSNSAVDPDKDASGEVSPMHRFGKTLASFAKSTAHEVKLNSKIAVLKTRIENAKQIELRKAHYALGRKLYEARILLSMQDEIEGLERQLAEKGARAVIEENETKGAMLKRVGKNAAKSAESELLSLKLKQSLTHLGELARNSPQENLLHGSEAELEAILLVESKIQQFVEEASSLKALSGDGRLRSKKPWRLLTGAAAIIFLGWTILAWMGQEKKHSESQITSDRPKEQDQSLVKQSNNTKETSLPIGLKESDHLEIGQIDDGSSILKLAQQVQESSKKAIFIPKGLKEFSPSLVGQISDGSPIRQKAQQVEKSTTEAITALITKIRIWDNKAKSLESDFNSAGGAAKLEKIKNEAGQYREFTVRQIMDSADYNNLGYGKNLYGVVFSYSNNSAMVVSSQRFELGYSGGLYTKFKESINIKLVDGGKDLREVYVETSPLRKESAPPIVGIYLEWRNELKKIEEATGTMKRIVERSEKAFLALETAYKLLPTICVPQLIVSPTLAKVGFSLSIQDRKFSSVVDALKTGSLVEIAKNVDLSASSYQYNKYFDIRVRLTRK